MGREARDRHDPRAAGIHCSMHEQQRRTIAPNEIRHAITASGANALNGFAFETMQGVVQVDRRQGGRCVHGAHIGAGQLTRLVADGVAAACFIHTVTLRTDRETGERRPAPTGRISTDHAAEAGHLRGGAPRPIKAQRTQSCRPKSFRIKMPETGLEPARPLRSPGPQPGASANSATPAGHPITLWTRRPENQVPTASPRRFFPAVSYGRITSTLTLPFSVISSRLLA